MKGAIVSTDEGFASRGPSALSCANVPPCTDGSFRSAKRRTYYLGCDSDLERIVPGVHGPSFN